MHVLELLGIALAPGVAIMIYIYLKDKHEREPLGLLLMSFVYGALSTIITLTLNWPLDIFFVLKQHDLVHEFYDAFFKVALIEEFSKFLFVRLILYPNKNFNEPFDGIVYAVMVSMGFATIENVQYVFEFGLRTGLLRMFSAVPAHATFGVMMGFYLGRAKFTHRKGLYFSLMALFSATLFHGAYDYFFFLGDIKGMWTYIWIGGILSLIIGIVMSRSAIRLHQLASPFMKQAEIEVQSTAESQQPTVDGRGSSS